MLRFSLAAAMIGAALASGSRLTLSDQDRLQGDWEVVSFESNGQQDTGAVGDVDRFADGKLYVIDKNDPCDSCEFAVTLATDKDPKEIDLTGEAHEDIEPGTETMKGIYRLERDKLVVCIGDGGGERPTEFKAGDGEEFCLIVLKRKKSE